MMFNFLFIFFLCEVPLKVYFRYSVSLLFKDKTFQLNPLNTVHPNDFFIYCTQFSKLENDIGRIYWFIYNTPRCLVYVR